MSAVASMPGSLVRGGLIQPGSPYFQIQALRPTRSQYLQQTEDADANDFQRTEHATNPGMKKIFGSVRRALSTRQPMGTNPQLGGLANQRQPPYLRSSNPGAASTVSVSGGVQKRRTAPPRPQARIDVLAASVAESFKQAVREELDNESQQLDGVEPPELGGFEFEFEKRGTPVQDDRQKSHHPTDPRVQSAITSGSKSIVIIDDTGAPPLPIMSGALPAEIERAVTKLDSHQREALMDERLASDSIPPVEEPELYYEPESRPMTAEQRISRTSTRPPLSGQRRSISAGPERMHSFRRRGSTKTSLARNGSLRRHASYNSVLSRRQGPVSIATFQTMSSDNDPFFLDRQPVTEATGPARQLRRRPGGDLRAADNIHDLEAPQRPHSTGSVSNRTHSVTNSVILRSDRFIDSGAEIRRQVEEPPEAEVSRKPISLVDTHSSQPNLRPSFEAEVAKLAALPDDTDDEGGVESALMKLEGRYEKKSPSIPSQRATVDLSQHQTTEASEQTIRPHTLGQGDRAGIDDVFHRPWAPPEADGQGMYRLSAESFNPRIPPVHSVGESTDSYSSIPLLDRGFSEIATPVRTHTFETMRSSGKPSPLQFGSISPQSARAPGTSSSMNSSIEHVNETDSMKRIPAGGTLPKASAVRESFLLDEDEDLSDAASTAGAYSNRTSHGVRSFFDDEPVTPEVETDGLPPHPMRHPPTPPLTGNRLNDELPSTTMFERGLPTPGLTPTVSRATHPAFPQSVHLADSPIEPHEFQQPPATSTAHLPFILAYDSEVLAQQFTIVEKDALDEIDWKELIELRWKQSSPQIRDWVQYLRTEEARGVDVVIARFNLVVKWVVSECLLTEDIHERARCIVKYIHIATHARRYRNYASMYQIAIALISNDLSKLKKTWALIPAAEMLIMTELEALVQPLKNFHNLRLEMETATVEEGCIPFIGKPHHANTGTTAN
jgi:hypothetical protein